MYTALFQRGEVRTIPSAAHGASAIQIADDSCDTFRSPPRPLPYDDPRCSPVQRDGLISRREKASCHRHEEIQPLRISNDSDTGNVVGGKWKGSEFEGETKFQYSESSLKKPAGEVISGLLYFFASTEEDEDVCPTCLEEYTNENPRITMKCNHHFHLGCIYEWMERSEACPVCGKVMAFNEDT